MEDTRIARENVAPMFDAIAPRYDLLNRLLSCRRDVAWRRVLARDVAHAGGRCVLDLATGTGDVLDALRAGCPFLELAVGMDFSRGMLAIGREKLYGKKKVGRDRKYATDENECVLVRGDALHIPLAGSCVDAVTIAFGLRNLPDPRVGLEEMRRVIRPGGRLFVLEFGVPARRWIRAAYLAYFRHVLPRIGGALSGNETAYRYLNRSAEAFPHGEALCTMLREAGFHEVSAKPLTFGVAVLYEGIAQ